MRRYIDNEIQQADKSDRVITLSQSDIYIYNDSPSHEYFMQTLMNTCQLTNTDVFRLMKPQT